MCKKYVALTIYRCGNRVASDFKFDPCWDMAAAHHAVWVGELGSKRARSVCGMYTCEVCRARLGVALPVLQDLAVL
ncbi:hypothetical protein IMZ48_37465 [Candidatus Bathyarchaeota archaeon]|nr:hypothetical protein [Candidatus Bathyarchaeota archaeon]